MSYYIADICSSSENIEINTIASILCRIPERENKTFEKAERIHISSQMATICCPRVVQYFETQKQQRQNQEDVSEYVGETQSGMGAGG